MHPLKLTRPALAAIFLFLLFLPGCVKSSTYQRAQDELAQARRGQEELSARMAAELARRDERETRLRDQMATLQREMDRLIEDLGTARRELLVAQEDLAASQLEASRLANLLSAQGAEAQRLRGRLDQLSSIEQEIRERNRIYEEVLGRFRSLIDAGRLSVSISRGRLVINLPQDILFASGSATLGRDGRQTVAEVASVLAEIKDRRFQVEGHTDNVPISTAQFPSNWELSAARALSVVKILVEQGVAPDNVSGAGYGEHHPVATNSTPDGRRLNRRIEIVMLPNLDIIAESGVGG
jgi:chemotaxis protein MotB